MRDAGKERNCWRWTTRLASLDFSRVEGEMLIFAEEATFFRSGMAFAPQISMRAVLSMWPKSNGLHSWPHEIQSFLETVALRQSRAFRCSPRRGQNKPAQGRAESRCIGT